MDIQDKVRETLQKHEMLQEGDGVLVAVSGGPDSIALLHLLVELREERSLRLEVAHLHHGIRGEEARRDALFVADLAKTLELPFHLKEINLAEVKSEKGKGNLEAMAREERYHFFGALAEERGISKVATGHTQDDQAETVLMWLLRGTGRRGLGGMSPVRPLNTKGDSCSEGPLVIRPLIDVSREEICRYLEKKSLEYRTDWTNEETKLLRNWIRLHLLPELKQNIDPMLPARLVHLAEVLRDEERFLQHNAREELRKVQDGKDLSRAVFLQRDKGLQRRLLRLWIERVLGDLRRFDFQHIEDALRLIAQGRPQGRLSLPRGWELVRDYEILRLEKRKPKVKPVCYCYPLAYDSELDIIEAAVKIRTQRLSSAPAVWPTDATEAFFDLSSLPRELTVRNFRRGDRFQPLGMKGHKKVKDLFIEKRLSLSVRSRLPLILAAEEILWIPGYARSDLAKILPETKEILRVKVLQQRG